MRLLTRLLPAVAACCNLARHSVRCPHVCCSSEPPPSRSTAREEVETFHHGAGDRAAKLTNALASLGFEDMETLLGQAEFRGSAALRTYNSFVWPKSAGALANAEKPGRVQTIAQSIAFYVREQRAARTEWLRNHDRALAEVPSSSRHPLHLVLDNVRSAANVGNLLRAAEAARCASVSVCGITPAPPEPKLMKTAMGAAEYVPHEREASTLRAVRALQQRGIQVWACETTSDAVDLPHATLPRPLALVLGNELIGVDVEVLAACDGVVRIPMYGVKSNRHGAFEPQVLPCARAACTSPPPGEPSVASL